MEKRLFTSESVTEGHPDKVCDAISDAILDACMEQDPMSRVACETACCTGFVLITGEITTNAYVDMQKVVRETVKEIGYTKSEYGFDGNTCAVLVAIDEQSADIAMGVDKALEAKENKMSDEEIEAIGAGDQGMMFGYATNETEEYMPYSISLAHKLTKKLTEVRKNGTLPYLRPDGKSQVTVEYDENEKPLRLEAVVLSTQHDDDVTQEQIHEDITYDGIYSTQDNLWNFLFFTGYLKVVSKRFEDRRIYLTMSIPNDEVLTIYEDTIREWFDKQVKAMDFQPFYQAVLHGDTESMEDFLSGLLEKSISYYDNKEAFYHGVMVGLFGGFCGYQIKSNREKLI